MCIACGMPMKTKDDFAMEDESKDYCKYCSREDGSMQTYNEKLVSLTDFISKAQGLDEQAANNVAKEVMAKLPAWTN